MISSGAPAVQRSSPEPRLDLLGVSEHAVQMAEVGVEVPGTTKRGTSNL